MMKVKHSRPYRTELELQQSRQSCLVRIKTNFSSFLGIVRFIRGRAKDIQTLVQNKQPLICLEMGVSLHFSVNPAEVSLNWESEA